MPYEGPGQRTDRVLTRAPVQHGDPVVEDGIPGRAAKSTQGLGGVPNAANAAAAREIAVGETFVLQHGGIGSIRADLLPAGAAEGDALYIDEDDNTLADAAEALTGGLVEAGYRKFGLLVDMIDESSEDHVLVNFDLRDTF